MAATMCKLFWGAFASLPLCFVASTALAVEVAKPCTDDPLTCEAAPIAFSREVALPVMGGFDTGWVPSNSALQVHLFAQLFANTKIALAGQLVTSWPDVLTLHTPGTPGAGSLGIHYGVDIGAEAHVHVTVLGQTFDWTGPIPYLPQFDYQVDANNAFDPWAFQGVTVDGSTLQQKLAQVSVTSFIGVNIPGLDGGFELDTKMDLAATYKTRDLLITFVDGSGVEGGPIVAEDGASLAKYMSGPSIEFDVRPEGEVVYDGKLHLIPAFYITTIGPDFNIPIVDVPIPFHFEQKEWTFDPVRVHVPLPDIFVDGDPTDVTPPSESANVIDLGTVQVGAQSAKKVTIQNVGEAALAAGFASSDPAHFTLSSATAKLETAHSFDELVIFTATEPGEFTTTVAIASNDPDEPTRTIQVKAVAVGPGDGATPPPIDPGAADAQGGGCGCRLADHQPTQMPLGLALGAALSVAAIQRRRTRRVG